MYYNTDRKHTILDALAILRGAFRFRGGSFHNNSGKISGQTVIFKPDHTDFEIKADVSGGILSVSAPNDTLDLIGRYAGGYRHDVVDGGAGDLYLRYNPDCPYDTARLSEIVSLREVIPLSAENKNDVDDLVLGLEGMSKVWSDRSLAHWKENSVSYIINMKPEDIRDALCNRVGCSATLISDVLTIDGKDRSHRVIATVNDTKTMSTTCARYIEHHPEALSFSRDRFGDIVSKATILTTSINTAEQLHQVLSCITVVRPLDDYVRWHLGGSAAGMDSIEAKPRRVSFYKEDTHTGEARYISVDDMEEIADTLSAKVNGKIDYGVLGKMLAHAVGHDYSDGVFAREDVSGCHAFDNVEVRHSGLRVAVSLDDRFDKNAEGRSIPDGYFAISVSKPGDASPLAKTLLSRLEDMGAVSYEEAMTASRDRKGDVSKSRGASGPHI